MAFIRPTLADLTAQVQNDFVSRLPLSGAPLRRSLVRVLVLVYAGALHMLYGFVDFVARQIFADTADAEFLARQAAVFGITKNPASFAEAVVSGTGTNGAVVLTGTIVARTDGAEYITTADGTVVGGVVSLPITALVAGSAGSLTPSAVLAFESPVAGVAPTVVVVSKSDGTDIEGTEAFRARFLEHLREPPQGGTVADYVAWAKDVAGVTRVWVYPLAFGPGTVVVRFVRDDDVSPIPDAGEIADVQAAINAVKPAHANVTVVAPTALAINFTLHIEPDTGALRTAATASLKDFVETSGAPGAVLLLSGALTALGTTPGLTDYTLTVPAANVTPTVGQLPIMGAVTFV